MLLLAYIMNVQAWSYTGFTCGYCLLLALAVSWNSILIILDQAHILGTCDCEPTMYMHKGL